MTLKHKEALGRLKNLNLVQTVPLIFVQSVRGSFTHRSKDR